MFRFIWRRKDYKNHSTAPEPSAPPLPSNEEEAAAADDDINEEDDNRAADYDGFDDINIAADIAVDERQPLWNSQQAATITAQILGQ